jgi:hypothetical protein
VKATQEQEATMTIKETKQEERAIDQAVENTFPASDPPAFSGVHEKPQEPEGDGSDERAQRRAGEAAGGGESSQASAEKRARGDKPAGTHEGGAAQPADNTYEEIGVKRGDGQRETDG